MNKTFIIAKREYSAAVKTKGFLISLILLPIFMGGGMGIFALMKDKVDVNDKIVTVIDHSEIFADLLIEAAELHNQNNTLNEEGEKIAPHYFFKSISVEDENLQQTKHNLSQEVKSKKIHAFLEIGKNILHPDFKDKQSNIFYYSENSAIDGLRSWINNVINEKIREKRLLELGIEKDKVSDLFFWIQVEGMGLISVDERTGELIDAEKKSELQTIMVPYVLILLMFMMMMMSSVPLLTAVMEEKSERIAEVLLGSVSSTQFMFGKILGSLGVSLTISLIYIIAGVFTLNQMELQNLIPYDVLPWFFVFLFLNIIMVGAIMASLGSLCNDSKDAQAIQFPAMLPIIIPLFLMMPVIMDPLSSFSTGMSLVPIWTPMLMVLRQSTSVTIPMWEIITGLAGVILFTIFTVWAGARIFRSAIIMQGKRPKLKIIFKYIFKG